MLERFARRYALHLVCLAPLLAFPALAASDNDQIRALVERYYSAANAKDLEGVMACFASRDTILVFEPLPETPFVGTKAVRKDWADFLMQMKEIQLKFTDVVVSSDGKLGFSHFFEETNLTMMSGQRVHGRLRATQVYEKIEGHWLIVQEHKSAPMEDPGK